MEYCVYKLWRGQKIEQVLEYFSTLEAQSGRLKSEDYLDKKDSISPEEWYRRRMMNAKNRHSFSFGQ